MDLDFDKELKVCEEATPGPWTADGKSVTSFAEQVYVADSAQLQDLAFIAAARTGYPEALRRLKRLREIIGNPEPVDAIKAFQEIRDLLNIKEN